jgi:four helix bundle protein
LTDADGELQETMHWLARAREYGYINLVRYQQFMDICLKIGGMLGKMMKTPESFS